MISKLTTICLLSLIFLVIQVDSQGPLFNLFQSGGGAAEHGEGPNIHTLFKYGSPSYYGSNSEQHSSAPSMNSLGNPYFQQQQPVYRYPQNYYYPQQNYYG